MPVSAKGSVMMSVTEGRVGMASVGSPAALNSERYHDFWHHDGKPGPPLLPPLQLKVEQIGRFNWPLGFLLLGPSLRMQLFSHEAKGSLVTKKPFFSHH